MTSARCFYPSYSGRKAGVEFYQFLLRGKMELVGCKAGEAFFGGLSLDHFEADA
jgi:hypothetical protein